MTEKELKIQKKLREIARDERKNKGSMVKIGFQKITINNVMMKWDIHEGKSVIENHTKMNTDTNDREYNDPKY